MADFIPSIGLEIHAELKTRTKMFCDCLNNPDEAHPNVNVCPVCIGHPGTLPTINKKALELVLKAAVALGAEIPARSKFDRKNYFYPDLPRGYQISQYDEPLALGGELEIGSEEKRRRIKIRRIHLEEDTGRNIHPEGATYSLVDFNRAGVPLMELVTEPDMHSAEEVAAFARELQLLFRYLGVSDADMEKGQMRLEANISISSGKALGTKVEVKNLNSFRALEEAIRYEIGRQTDLLESGKAVAQETRGWDDTKKKTFSQRGKEEAQDYRYFPEPDLPPLDLTKFDLEKLRREVPELPWVKRLRLQKEYGFSVKDAELFVGDPAFAEFFERAVSELKSFDPEAPAQLLANYLSSDLRGLLAAKSAAIGDIRISPEHFAHLVSFVSRGKISSRGAKDALKRMFETGADIETVIRESGIEQISDTEALERFVTEAVEQNPKAADDYRKGKPEALQFLVGQVMAKSRGAANPKIVEELLKRAVG